MTRFAEATTSDVAVETGPLLRARAAPKSQTQRVREWAEKAYKSRNAYGTKTATKTTEILKRGERLFKFLAGLILDRLYGSVTIKFEHGKVAHVEQETRRLWQYKDLPDPASTCGGGDAVRGVRMTDRSGA
jgi:hypothetical protein